jgi:hypothetical protein
VWINAVPRPKIVKNRMHLDVHARSVDELLALGATVVEEFPRWTVMADPEGGEFCAFVREEPPPYRLYEIGLDAADARKVGRWWADLLGGRYVDEGKEFVYVADIPGAPFASLDVEVHPVLHDLRPGHRVDPHRVLWRRAAQNDVAVIALDELEYECRRPEPAEAERVDGVETEILVRGRCHRRSVENLQRVCRSTPTPLV